MPIDIRPIRDDELEDFRHSMALTFGNDALPEDRERFSKAFELDRLLGAFDGHRVIGTFAALTTKLSVPGGQLPMAGTAGVTVLATHRRQG